MQIPDYAIFRCGSLDWADDNYLALFGTYDKQEVYEGVFVGDPPALCWPPIAMFWWDWKRLLSEEDYQALSFPPGWQTELYRGVVLVWTSAEAETIPAELESYREEARRWIEKHVPATLEDS
jgi:hypothetical protein